MYRQSIPNRNWAGEKDAISLRSGKLKGPYKNAEWPCLMSTVNGEANNFKMDLVNDIHEGSGGC